MQHRRAKSSNLITVLIGWVVKCRNIFLSIARPIVLRVDDAAADARQHPTFLQLEERFAHENLLLAMALITCINHSRVFRDLLLGDIFYRSRTETHIHTQIIRSTCTIKLIIE